MVAFGQHYLIAGDWPLSQRRGWSPCSKWWSLPHPVPSAGLIFLVCARIKLKAPPYLPAPAVYLAANWNPCRQKLHNWLIKESLEAPGWSHRHRAFQGFFASVNIHAQWLARTPRWLRPFIWLQKKMYVTRLCCFVDVVVLHAVLRNWAKWQTWPEKCWKLCALPPLPNNFPFLNVEVPVYEVWLIIYMSTETCLTWIIFFPSPDWLFVFFWQPNDRNNDNENNAHITVCQFVILNLNRRKFSQEPESFHQEQQLNAFSSSCYAEMPSASDKRLLQMLRQHRRCNPISCNYSLAVFSASSPGVLKAARRRCFLLCPQLSRQWAFIKY